MGNSSKTKLWIWSAVGLLITNLVVVGIVAFLIHRDSLQYKPNQPATQQRQLQSQVNEIPLAFAGANLGLEAQE
ncbi:MAG: hypothetical protein RMX63_19785 [Aulosira sp. ZfuCHP01]|nr:hypothetical protein [Aulosira sp. ZfuVER01]MDZ7998933.1 hypothetical protein [Aulosira sp. DedVER01a]MDZ8053673.1 hypothetical protein [Aulosira sp. ZfuCHP01]